MRNLLIATIALSIFTTNATTTKKQDIKLPAGPVSIITSSLELQDLARFGNTCTANRLKAAGIINECREIKQEGNRLNRICRDLIQGDEMRELSDFLRDVIDERMDQYQILKGRRHIDVIQAAREMEYFASTYTNVLSPATITREFIFTGSKKGIHGVVPSTNTYEQSFLGTRVNEHLMPLRATLPQVTGLEVDLILSNDHNHIIAVRNSNRIYLLQLPNGHQCKVSNTHQNRSALLFLSHTNRFTGRPISPFDIAKFTYLFLSDEEIVRGDDPVIGFFDDTGL